MSFYEERGVGAYSLGTPQLTDGHEAGSGGEVKVLVVA